MPCERCTAPTGYIKGGVVSIAGGTGLAVIFPDVEIQTGRVSGDSARTVAELRIRRVS